MHEGGRLQVERGSNRSTEIGSSMAVRGDPPPEVLARWAAAISDGDAVAFESLFHTFYDRLCDYAEAYVRSPHTAEEIVDDVFLALWSRRDRLRLERSVASYLYIAVRNRALTHLRRATTERAFAAREEARSRHEVPERGSEVEDTVRSRELFAHAQRAIEALPPRVRETYLLFYRHGRSYAEIAEMMGVSVRTVENQLARSLKRLWLALHEQLD